jgi:hypothetical protein
MTKDQVKAMLDRVLTWPREAQEEAVASLAAIEEQFAALQTLSPDDCDALSRSAEDMRQGKYARRWLLWLGALALLLRPRSVGSAEPGDNSNLASSDLQKRGTQLRAALEDAYRHLKNYPRRERSSGINVSEVVSPYIPIGSSFKDAEQILANAGFEIIRPSLEAPPKPQNRSEDWYAVLGEIQNFAHGLFYVVRVYVSLLPPSPGDYSVVSKVTGTFYVRMP